MKPKLANENAFLAILAAVIAATLTTTLAAAASDPSDKNLTLALLLPSAMALRIGTAYVANTPGRQPNRPLMLVVDFLEALLVAVPSVAGTGYPVGIALLVLPIFATTWHVLPNRVAIKWWTDAQARYTNGTTGTTESK